MEVERSASYTRDLRRTRSTELRRRLDQTISELEGAPAIGDVSNAVRMQSASGRYYRIRIGDYRLGVAIDDDVAILVRFLHRLDIYRSFP